MTRRSGDPTTIDAEVGHVRSLGIDALRARWRTMFETMPPTGLSKDILARMIAHRLQERALGALDREAVKLLDRLGRGEQAAEFGRHINTGTVLVWEHKGERHTVTIVQDGFVWQGTTYASLSMIARLITGTTWNGPRFFGLRIQGTKNAEEVPQRPRRPSQSRRIKAERVASTGDAGSQTGQIRSDG